MNKEKMDIKIMFRVSKRERDKLKELAQKEGRTMSNYVRYIIRNICNKEI